MTISSDFTVNGAVPTDAVAVEPGSTVLLAMLNTGGLEGIVWSVEGNDHRDRVNPNIVAAGSPPGATASFVVPADSGDGLGQAYRIQCFASDGGSPRNTSTSRALIGVANPAGLVPFAAGEDLDRHAVYGWTEAANRILAGDLRALYSVTNFPVVAVGSEPGWNVAGTFLMPTTSSVALDMIGCVSNGSLTLTAILYCISPGFVGPVAGSEAETSSVIDERVLSGFFTLTAGRMYQVRAQVVGAAGDDYFGSIRRVAPSGV